MVVASIDRLKELGKESLGFRAVMNHGLVCRLFQVLHPILHMIAKPAGSTENSDHLVLIVGDGEFIEGSHASADKDQSGACPDIEEVSAFEPQSRVDDQIVVGEWHPQVGVFCFVGSGRKADDLAAFL